LVAAGALGIPLAIATLFMREPPRIHLRDAAAPGATHKAPGFMAAFRDHPRALAAHFIGFTAMAFAAYGATAWLPTLFIREYGWTPAMVGARLGLVALIAGPLGTVFGGLLADRLEKARRYDGKFLVGALAAACTAVPAIVLGLSSHAGATFAAAVVVIFCTSLVWGVAPGALQEIVHGSVLGRVTAIYTALLNLVALGLGPPTVALLGESIAGKHGGLGLAMAIVVPTACLVAFLAFVTSRSAYKRARHD
jgi:MFS family permease